MARKRNLTPFNYYHTMSPKGKERHYLRLPQSMMQTPAVQGLSNSAYRVFVEMMNVGCWKSEFTFTRKQYVKFMSSSTFVRAVKELELAGIIVVKEHNQNLRKPNVYAWSDKWKPNAA